MQVEVSGIALGVLIGLISDINVLLLLRPILRSPGSRSTFATRTQLLAVPTFWFGGPWVSTAVLKLQDWSKIEDSYLVSLAIVFGPVACLLLVVLMLPIIRPKGR
jgi:hypothetical protein